MVYASFKSDGVCICIWGLYLYLAGDHHSVSCIIQPGPSVFSQKYIIVNILTKERLRVQKVYVQTVQLKSRVCSVSYSERESLSI